MATGKIPSTRKAVRTARNEDPITGAKGAHPVGTGVGAVVGGATTGAIAGALGGPAGAVAGAVIGGVAGAYAGKAVAEEIDPTVESAYWKNVYETRPYYDDSYTYDDYEPAYQAGWESTCQGDVPCWESQEAAARERWEQRWENEGGSPKMTWTQARLAAKDAFERASYATTLDCAPCKAR